MRRLPVVAALAVGLAPLFACTPPDRPAALVPPLDGEALAVLAPDSQRAFRVGDGIFYRYVWSSAGPWAVHLVSAETARCDVRPLVVPALGDDGITRARRLVSEMQPVPSARPLVGINGDFFAQDGAPTGSEITDRTQRLASRPALAWRDPDEPPWIGVPALGDGRADFGGVGVSADSPASPLLVLSGFPELLADGALVGDLEVRARPAFAAARHPRTAVGFDRDRGVLWLIVVDGRQPSYSIGMTLPELARVFEALGVEDALNLDGGGSSAMLVRGRIASRPSDPAGERAVGNSLWLTGAARGCRR